MVLWQYAYYVLIINTEICNVLYSREQDVAIKYVHKTTFSVTNSIKKEIYQIR